METDNRQQKMAEYIQSLAAIEDCMRPYRESRKELRKNFIENAWLDKDEISLATRHSACGSSRLILMTLLRFLKQ